MTPKIILSLITLTVILIMIVVDYFQLAFSKFNFIDFEKKRERRIPPPNYALFLYVLIWHIPFGLNFQLSRFTVTDILEPSLYSVPFALVAYFYLDSRREFKSLKTVMYSYAVVALLLRAFEF